MDYMNYKKDKAADTYIYKGEKKKKEKARKKKEKADKKVLDTQEKLGEEDKEKKD